MYNFVLFEKSPFGAFMSKVLKVNPSGRGPYIVPPPVNGKVYSLTELVTVKKYQDQILTGRLKFPICVEPAEHLKDTIKIDRADPEKIFRAALKRKEYEFAHFLLNDGIMPIDTDFIFECCVDTSDEALNMVYNALTARDKSSIHAKPFPRGMWKRELFTCLHQLFFYSHFTEMMEKVAMVLSTMCNVNDCNYRGSLFVQLVSRGLLSVQKVKMLISMGFDFSINVEVSDTDLRRGKKSTTILNYLTSEIGLDDMIEILLLIRDAQRD